MGVLQTVSIDDEFISGQNVEQTIDDILARRPMLASVLHAFAPIIITQQAILQELSAFLKADGWMWSGGEGGTLPTLYIPSALDRVQDKTLHFALEAMPLRGLAPALKHSAEKLLPRLAVFDIIQPHISALERIFLQPVKDLAGADLREDLQEDTREILAEAKLAGNTAILEHIAAKANLSAPILDFIAGFILSPVLHALVSLPIVPFVCDEAIEALHKCDALKESNDLELLSDHKHQQGQCPICGSSPSIAFLDKPKVDGQNPFLAGGGGKKYLHCSLCGTDWRFQRGACPACGEKGDGVIEILRASGVSHGERIDWCTKCKTYCPTLDLREYASLPNLDVIAIGMMHLDMVAANKHLHPLRQTFWNTF